MSELYANLTLLVCLWGAIWAHVYAWHALGAAERLPLVVFSGSYLATSAIGATIVGLLGVDYLESIKYGLDTGHLHEIASAKYWLLVYLPLIVPPLIAALLGSARAAEGKPGPLLAHDVCFPALYLLVFVVSAGFCVYCLKSSGFNVALTSWWEHSSDYSQLIAIRSNIMASAGFLFFRIVYVALPALSFAALFQVRRHGTAGWWLLFAATAIATAWLGLATIQKSLLLVYVASLAAGLIVLRVASYRHLIYGGLLGCVLLTVMQQFFTNEWTFFQSISHVVHRLPVAFPYYVVLYPQYVPYEEFDVGLASLGIGRNARDNVVVFAFMYPDIVDIVGHAAAPAHLRMYAQCGMAGAFGSLILIGCGLGLMARLSRRVSGPIAFAIYVQALVTIYYATQTGLIDLLISSYGMPWCVITLGPLWLIANQLRHRRGIVVDCPAS